MFPVSVCLGMGTRRIAEDVDFVQMRPARNDGFPAVELNVTAGKPSLLEMQQRFLDFGFAFARNNKNERTPPQMVHALSEPRVRNARLRRRRRVAVDSL